MRAINTFWNWFQDNNKTIQNLINETPKNQKHISFWINKNLGYYCKEIDFILVFPNNNKSKLITTLPFLFFISDSNKDVNLYTQR
jgi:hypothetical protein